LLVPGVLWQGGHAVMTALDWWLVVLAAILVGAVYAWLVTPDA
jgi:hypothetical protein